MITSYYRNDKGQVLEEVPNQLEVCNPDTDYTDCVIWTMPYCRPPIDPETGKKLNKKDRGPSRQVGKLPDDLVVTKLETVACQCTRKGCIVEWHHIEHESIENTYDDEYGNPYNLHQAYIKDVNTNKVFKEMESPANRSRQARRGPSPPREPYPGSVTVKTEPQQPSSGSMGPHWFGPRGTVKTEPQPDTQADSSVSAGPQIKRVRH